MARSLDELIDFLLEEIALGGELGLSFSEIAAATHKFYEAHPEQTNIADAESESVSGCVHTLPNVDRAFLAKLWKWLSRHSDVSIGKNRQYNDKTLDDVENLFPGYVASDNNPDTVGKVMGSRAQSVDSLNEGRPLIPASTGADKNGGPRFYVNEVRMWTVICGHPPDLARVYPMEWVLMLCIAATKENGILQGDLIRASGQDKRSVPKRTDALHEKGYIIKKVIYLKGNKSSHLYLRRFVDMSQPSSGMNGTSADKLTIRHLARQIFDVLKNSPLVPLEDLRDALGMTTAGRSKVLNHLIRSFSKLGLLKRVKTAFGPSARMNDLKTCIQYLKEPAEELWHENDPQILNLSQSVEVLASYYEAEAGQAITDVVNDGEAADENEEVDPTSAEEDSDKTSRFDIPQWNPDRSLANVLHDVVNEAGTSAINNSRIRRIITGPFVRRTVESLLVKASNRALQAQPASLRHLAILRTLEYHNNMLQYLYHAFHVFADQVRSGKAKWEDVSGGKEFLKQLAQTNNDTSSITRSTETDSWGFATRPRPAFQSYNGEASMSRLIQESKLKNLECRAGEPFLVEVAPGTFEVFYNRSGANKGPVSAAKTFPKGKNISPAKKPAKPKKIQEPGYVVQGRPRKFFRGTEKYWRDILSMVVRAQDTSSSKARTNAGITNDPKALDFFRNRPVDFDQTLVQAMERGLPMAAEPSQINQEWVDKMTTILQRSQPGLYITPVGTHPGRRRRASMQLILRSDRLHEIDWSSARRCWPWRFLSSSHAHSFRCYQRETQPRDVAQYGEALSRRSSSLPQPRSKKAKPSMELQGGVCSEETQLAQTLTEVSTDVQSPDLTGQVQQTAVIELFSVTDGNRKAPPAQNPGVESQVSALNEVNIPAVNSMANPLFSSKPNNEASSGGSTMAIGLTRSTRKRKLTQKAVESLEAHLLTAGTFDVLQTYPLSMRETSYGLQSKDERVTAEPTTEVEPTFESVEVHNQPILEAAPTLGSTMSEIDESAQNLLRIFAKRDTSSKQIEEQDAQSIRELDNDRLENLMHVSTQYQVNEQFTTDSVRDRAVVDTQAVLDRPALANSGGGVQELSSTLFNASDAVPPVSEAPEILKSQAQSQEAQGAVNVLEDRNGKSQQRSRATDTQEDLTPEVEPSGQMSQYRKRVMLDGLSEATRPEVSRACRIMVLELVGLCSGLVPNVPWTLRRAMVPKWQEAGISSIQLSAKNVRAAIKSLCANGKLKQMTFAFRGKSGAMIKMSVLTLRGIDATNPAVIELQNKMQDMEPADYIPFELEVEGRRAPNELNRKRYNKEIRLEGVPVLDQRASNTPRSSRKQRNETHASDPRSTSGQPTEEQIDLVRRIDETRAPPSPSPEPVITLNTGFLTLSIPRLRELNIPTEHHFRFKPTLDQIQFGPYPIPIPPNTRRSIPQVAKRGDLRGRRNVRFDPKTHRLIWKKPHKLKLPSSLDDIPDVRVNREQAALTTEHDPDFRSFEAEVDCVAAWEEKVADRFIETRAERLIFINHNINGVDLKTFDNYPVVHFEALICYDRATGQEIELALPPTKSWPPFTAAFQQDETYSKSVIDNKAVGRQTRRTSKRKADDTLDEDEYQDSSITAKKRKPSGKVLRPRRSVYTVLAEDEVDPSSYSPLKRNRITQLLRYLTEEEKYQVVVAVTIVRTLVGGIEKFIDWQLVCRLIPTQDTQTLKDVWKSMSSKYRSDLQELSESLQYSYLEALTCGDVPTVNFDSIYQTDWEGIFQWALANLDKTIAQRVEDLPASRGKLLKRNDYVFTEPKGVREMLGYNVILPVPKKEEILSGVVFGKPLHAKTTTTRSLETKPLAELEASDLSLSRAKSWIVSTLMAPESINPKTIQDKLVQVASPSNSYEALLEKATRALQRDKLVSRAHRIVGTLRGKARDEQGFAQLRQYEMSAKFFEQFDFRRMVTTAMLKRAMEYKLEVMDPAFQQGSDISISKDTILDDGEMVAILNLFAMGMIRIGSGPDVPASRWGLEWEKHGYTTRLVDKKVLAFSVVLTPVIDRYIHGDPLVNTRAGLLATIPRGEIDQPDGMGRIPIWFDITHQFHEEMWEVALGAILGLTSVRPGISVNEIVKTLWYGASVQEVEMILNWAERLSLVKRTSSMNGWETEEWWWMGVGTGGGWRVNDD